VILTYKEECMSSSKDSSDLGCFSLVLPLVGIDVLLSAWYWSLGQEPRLAVHNGIFNGTLGFICISILVLLVGILNTLLNEDKK
jgi:hypothetical protein